MFSLRKFLQFHRTLMPWALAALALFAASPLLQAQQVDLPLADQEAAARLFSYRLGVVDRIRVAITDEPDLAAEQLIDERGEVRLPLAGPVRVLGLTTREAQRRIEESYVEARLLRNPEANVVITAFRPRSVRVFGQVRSPGSISFPDAAEKLDIVDIISAAGGFTETARTNAVVVVRNLPDGTEIRETVDVASLLDVRRRSAERADGFIVLPGDRVFVSQRIF